MRKHSAIAAPPRIVRAVIVRVEQLRLRILKLALNVAHYEFDAAQESASRRAGELELTNVPWWLKQIGPMAPLRAAVSGQREGSADAEPRGRVSDGADANGVRGKLERWALTRAGEGGTEASRWHGRIAGGAQDEAAAVKELARIGVVLQVLAFVAAPARPHCKRHS